MAVDAVGLEERAASLAKRSIKKESKLWALDLAIRCMDLTTLEGTDTVGKIVALCAKAVRPDPSTRRSRRSRPSACTRSSCRSRSSSCRARACTSRASPARSRPASVRSTPGSARSREVVELGADEVDIVLNRSLFLGGRYAQAYDEIVAAREAAGAAHLKVILETGELGSYDRVRQASMLAMAAGADFIKTSTGKIGDRRHAAVGALHDGGRARLPPADRRGGGHQGRRRRPHVEAVDPVPDDPATRRSAPNWMTPDRFRIGASTLLNDVLMQIDKERTGRYQGRDYFTVD